MKRIIRSAMALTPWLSLAVPLFFFAVLMVLGSLFPNLFCVPVNPGAKEFICGADYSHYSIGLLRLLGFSAWVLLLVTGGAELFLGEVTRPAAVAWSVSGLMLIGVGVLLASLPVECTP